MEVVSYRDLVVWQKAIELTVAIYALTEQFPSDERFGLVAQMRRAAVSIPSNIAEGSRRSSKKDFRNFLLISYSSGAELETQIEIAKRLPWGESLSYVHSEDLLSQVMRMLNRMTVNLESVTA